jgi:RNA:NAD 2'-phosphotransferase (TPT1/KptA family)
LNEATRVDAETERKLYHVTDIANLPSILRDGIRPQAGSWLGASWKPRVFFSTTRIGAYEIANNFRWERRGVYAFVIVDPAKVRARLRPDRDYDQGVWVRVHVPPEAIIGVHEVDEDFFESDEFQSYMGCDEDDGQSQA